MAAPPNVRLNIANRPENVLLVRETLVGVAEAIELDRNDLEDIRTAVSEACNNVVLHAYEGDEGPLEIDIYVSAGAIEVVVRDRGIGLQPHAHAAQDTAIGLGLPVIGALTRRVEFRNVSGGGCEARMEFAAPSKHPLGSVRADGLEPPILSPAQSAGAVAMSIAPATLLPTVLPRVLGVLAVHARFSTDRLSDAQLLADTLAAHVPDAIGGDRLSVGVSVEPRNLELRIGPLGAGGTRQLIVDSVLEGVGAIVEQLADDHAIATAGSLETLALRMTDRR